MKGKIVTVLSKSVKNCDFQFLTLKTETVDFPHNPMIIFCYYGCQSLILNICIIGR
jgi:hypothetical protein